MSLRLLTLILILGGLTLQSAAAQSSTAAIAPPDHYFRTVERSMTGSSPFYLVRAGRPDFSIVVSDPNDEVLSTAAEDLAGYVE